MMYWTSRYRTIRAPAISPTPSAISSRMASQTGSSRIPSPGQTLNPASSAAITPSDTAKSSIDEKTVESGRISRGK